MKIWYPIFCLSFMLVITAQWYDRNQLAGEIERLKNQPTQVFSLGDAVSIAIEKGTIMTAPPQIEYRDRIVTEEVIKEVLVEVPVIVTKEVIREVIKKVPLTLRDFPDIQTAKEWVATHKPAVMLQANAQGVVKFLNPIPLAGYDCEDYAYAYQALAAKDGWNIYPVAVYAGQVWGIKATPINDDYHVGIMFRAAGTFYYLEASPPNQGYIVPLLNED